MSAPTCPKTALLIDVMARLRDPEGGCPWDVEQSFETIAPYTIEEAYEVADAIARGDMPALREELGDLLLQVVYHARMAEEAGAFDFEAVAATIADKMIRRHPHVFGDDEVEAYVKDFLDNFDWDAAAGGGGPTPETIEVGGKRMRFLKQGDGEGTPVILIHGFGGDCLGWLFNQEALAEDRTTYALDLPGHGGSDKDVGEGKLGVMVQAVLAFMDDRGIAKTHLVGHSMGGAIALALAAEHVERVASATLLAPAGLGREINMTFINGFIEQKRSRKLRPILELLVADPGMITNDMVEEVIKFKRLDGAVEALTRLRDGLFPGGEQESFPTDLLAGLSVPMQAIWGEEDQILPAAHAAVLPDSVKVRKLPATGHLPHMERASEVNAAILAFLA
ncbi:MAG: acetoin dehydrogenase dihydrolipoyllysine-residue acetyltransferase subunit [Rhodospirillales bacterium]|nr:acetoin dehydrogenase dihydrolipoyllysine-residue acetyltransferase subunit [Rhodospirillales bacterium]